VAALVEELAERLQSDGLTRLAGSANKLVSKAARKGLHRLRSHKVAVEVPVPQEAPRTGTGLLEEAELAGSSACTMAAGSACFGSPHRRAGASCSTRRASPPRTASSISRPTAARAAATSSSPSASASTCSRPSAPRPGALVHRGGGPALAPALARRARGHASASQLLGAAPRIEHPALAIEPAEVEPAKLLALFEERALSGWLPERSFLQRLDLKLQEVATSRIIVDERQRAAAVSAALELAVVEYHTPERISASRRLLLDTAHLMSLVKGPAALARAAADLFLLPPEKLCAHPLARAFLERLVRRPAARPRTPSSAARVASSSPAAKDRWRWLRDRSAGLFCLLQSSLTRAWCGRAR